MKKKRKRGTYLELGSLLRLDAALGPKLVSLSPHITSTDVLIFSGAAGITFVLDNAIATTQAIRLFPRSGTIYCPAILCPTSITYNEIYSPTITQHHENYFKNALMSSYKSNVDWDLIYSNLILNLNLNLLKKRIVYGSNILLSGKTQSADFFFSSIEIAFEAYRVKFESTHC